MIPNYRTFWKRQNYGDGRSVAARVVGEEEIGTGRAQ